MEDKKELALGYYIRKEKSVGKCAELAGISIEDFIIYLSENKISVFDFDEDDIKNA